MLKISGRVIIFNRRVGGPRLLPEREAAASPGKSHMLRAAALLTLALAVMIALFLAASVLGLIFAVPLIATALYSLVRFRWREWLRVRRRRP